ncbi:MAG: hypothetical protein ABI288_00175 [Ginsengibacter sp.]
MILQNEMEDDHSKWQESIEDFSQRNALLKYRLSEIVDSHEDKNFLQLAEYFQNELLLTDEILKRLRSELHEYAEMKKLDYFPTEKIAKKRRTFRNGILNFERKFLTLSDEFNKKMLESQKH